MTNLKEESRDVIIILHEQWRNTNTLKDVQRHILKILGSDPFVDTDLHSDEAVARTLQPSIRQLEKTLGRVIEHIANEPAARNIPLETWNYIRNLLAELIASNPTGVGLLPHQMREISNKVYNEILLLKYQTPKAMLPREQINAVLVAAKEVERLVCVFDLHRAIEISESTMKRIFSIIKDLRGDRSETEVGTYEINDVVDQVVDYFHDQADMQGTIINVKERAPTSFVLVNKADMIKALGNIIDNAIKYTGKLPINSRHKNTWIDVRIVQGVRSVSVKIESWGVPITEEERHGSFVFKAGYRGWFARKTGVPGTGTGLADVQDFAIANGGEVFFDSIPVKKASNIPTYSTTTVTLTLPLAP